MSLKPSDLLFVVGAVGSGKTTFLLSLMSETLQVSGTKEIKGKIAYVE